ncbi:MAG: OmpA family protein [Candidatus Acidiferrales bacterium]
MNRYSLPVLALGVLLLAGCATKKYVQTQVDPVNARVSQVDSKATETQKQLDTDEKVLSATTETAKSADSRAGDAINRADAASSKADQVRSDLKNELSERIADLDAYKTAGDAAVHFAFNSSKLTDEDKQQLDTLVDQNVKSLHRFFIAIEGYTDRVGPADYNLELSRRRAEAVQNYLVVEKSIPLYRIQIVGLGKQRPADEGAGRKANAANRRVEVSVFSADSAPVAAQKSDQN